MRACPPSAALKATKKAVFTCCCSGEPEIAVIELTHEPGTPAVVQVSNCTKVKARLRKEVQKSSCNGACASVYRLIVRPSCLTGIQEYRCEREFVVEYGGGAGGWERGEGKWHRLCWGDRCSGVREKHLGNGVASEPTGREVPPTADPPHIIPTMVSQTPTCLHSLTIPNLNSN